MSSSLTWDENLFPSEKVAFGVIVLSGGMLESIPLLPEEQKGITDYPLKMYSSRKVYINFGAYPNQIGYPINITSKSSKFSIFPAISVLKYSWVFAMLVLLFGLP